jgi:hypothetical protein
MSGECGVVFMGGWGLRGLLVQNEVGTLENRVRFFGEGIVCCFVCEGGELKDVLEVGVASKESRF